MEIVAIPFRLIIFGLYLIHRAVRERESPLISPLEVKSGRGCTLTSLKKFCRKFARELHAPYTLHSADIMEKDGMIGLPLYMTPLP